MMILIACDRQQQFRLIQLVSIHLRDASLHNQFDIFDVAIMSYVEYDIDKS
jgi:hypothetical protein